LALGLLIFAHVIADFMLQGKGIAQLKDEGRISGFIMHFLTVWLSMLLLLAPMLHFRLILSLTGMAILHVVFDIFKCWITRRIRPSTEVMVFLADQAVHILLLLVYWLYWEPINIISPMVKWSIVDFLPLAGREWFNKAIAPILNADLLATAVIYVVVVYGGAIFVRKVLNISPLSPPRTEQRSVNQILDTGRYIGMAERTILLIMTAMNATSAAAFVLTAKSIARYQELNQKDFAEYYLAGTLISAGVALLGGVFLRYLWGVL
jgi:uncharacterized membrane protein